MNRERVVSIFVALACIAAMGVASTTLESSLASDPDDAIKLDYDSLPIGKDDANEVKQEVQNNEQQQQQQQSQSSSSSSTTEQQQQQSGGGATEKQQDLLDMLLALLRELLPYIVAGLALLTVVGLLYRYRRRIIAPFLTLVPSFGGSGGTDGDATPEWSPRNDVEQAWLDLLQAAGVDRPQSKTTTECADAAIASGYDPEPVHSLRRAFEDARYGPGSVTDDHRDQAARSRQQLGLGGHGGTR